MKNTILLLLFSALLFSCSYSSEKQEKKANVDERFNSGMLEIVDKYRTNYHKNLDPTDSLSFTQMFDLKKRVILPSLKGLTFDYRSYNPCGGCWIYKVVHVYNDSMSFILPLTDNELFWKLSHGYINDKDLLERLNFDRELNALTKYFSIRDPEMLAFLVEQLLNEQGYWKLDLSDIPKLTMIGYSLIDNSFYSQSCRDRMKDNLKKTENKVRSGEMVYSDGINVFVFTVSKESQISIEMLNTDCNSMMLY